MHQPASELMQWLGIRRHKRGVAGPSEAAGAPLGGSPPPASGALPSSTAAGSSDSPVATITQVTGRVVGPDPMQPVASIAAGRPHSAAPTNPMATLHATKVPRLNEAVQQEWQLCRLPPQTIARMRAQWRNCSILEVRWPLIASCPAASTRRPLSTLWQACWFCLQCLHVTDLILDWLWYSQ